MITAQFDSIGYSHVLANLRREVLEDLWLLVQKRTDTTFFTVYLIVFMMLHEVSVACQDRRRRAKEQGLESYYDLEDVTAEIKRGADVILAHWHYYKGDLDPLVMSEARMTQAFGTDSTEEIRVLMATCQKYEQRSEYRLGVPGWFQVGTADTVVGKSLQNEATMEDDPLYLVSQMFERNWRPAHGS
ncbi:hypothetical protein NUW58_g10806 [Xylaria curta]|uniref:Uncharacterized protein n=1 Tax=Xylaria curta TaxID=42375 RepID=A0ACC1MFR6_9PEZI|nr:hypothetical protein NUW58_g10806 [Xylaria curta]